jgi:hypothetical protein
MIAIGTTMIIGHGIDLPRFVGRRSYKLKGGTEDIGR